MNEVVSSDWALVVFLIGLMCANAFFLGKIFVQAAMWLSKKSDRQKYRKWGVDGSLFWPNQGVWFTLWGIGVAVGALYTFSFAYVSMSFPTQSSWVGVGQVYDTFRFFSIALAIGIAVESVRFGDVLDKVERLERLREVFHSRFKPSDLLSVYESMKYAPSLFWDEYAQLTDEELSEEANQKYRERGAPYRYSLSVKLSRISILVGGLAVAIAILVAVGEFLW